MAEVAPGLQNAMNPGHLDARRRKIRNRKMSDTEEDPVSQHESAEKLFKEGRHEEAAQIYTVLAEKGSTDSQIFLGWMYQNGLGLERNLERAYELYKQAVSAGSTEGEFYLGRLCELQGKFDEAVEWLSVSAKKDYAPAMYRLGKLLEAGHPSRNTTEAMKYFEDAARKGHLIAQKDIALKMFKGQLGWTKVLEGFFMLLKTIGRIYKVAKDDPYDELIRR